jgi:preprotein translocase subunit SecG
MMLFTIFTLLFIVVSFAMVLIILVQRPQGGGLSTAFGGAGGGNDTAFGGRTGDALTVATVACFFLYLLIAIGLNMTDDTLGRPAARPATAESTPATTADGTAPAADAQPGRGVNNSGGLDSIPALPTTPTPIVPPTGSPSDPPAEVPPTDPQSTDPQSGDPQPTAPPADGPK